MVQDRESSVENLGTRQRIDVFLELRAVGTDGSEDCVRFDFRVQTKLGICLPICVSHIGIDTRIGRRTLQS
jgi:hypothetical protein